MKEKKSITIREIAAIAGVSPTAVSLVINGKKGVGEETRQTIHRVLKENNYLIQPKKARRAKQNIRLVKNYKTDEEQQGKLSSIINAIEKECQKYSYNLIVSNLQSGNQSEIIQTIIDNPLDGVLLLGTETTDRASIEKIKQVETKAPLILFDHNMFFLNVDSIVIANTDIIFSAIEYLYKMGHRDIGYLHGNKSSDKNFYERKVAFQNALARFDLQEKAIIPLSPTMSGAYEDMKQYLNSGRKVPAAVLAANDAIAIGAMKAMQEYGLCIPDDVSIIGIDDISYSEICTPQLTTMHMPCTLIGTEIIDLLNKRKEHPDWPYMRVQASAHLVERSSVLDMRLK